jgi:hypothetical protein
MANAEGQIVMVSPEGQLIDLSGFGSTAGGATGQRLMREAWYFLVGRMAGLLPHFPFAVLLLIVGALLAEERRPLLLTYGLLGLCAHWVWLRWAGQEVQPLVRGHGVWAMVYPLCLLLPPRGLGSKGGRRLWVTAPILLIFLLWIAPAWPGPWSSERASRWPLPLELTHLAEVEPFGFELHHWDRLVAVVPALGIRADNAGSPGLWVPAGRQVRIWLVSATELDPLSVEIRARSRRLRVRLRSSIETLHIPMDTSSKRRGVGAEIRLRPSARKLLGFYPRESYYSLELGVALLPMDRELRVGRAGAFSKHMGAHFDFSAAAGWRPGEGG